MPAFSGRLLASPSSARLLRRGRYVAAALCLVLAGVTALGSSRAVPTAARAPGRSVVVAAHDLPVGHVLRRADLTVRRWPPLLPPGAAFTSVPAAVGDRLASPLRRGEPLTPTRLITGDLTAGLAPGTVAVAVSLASPTVGLVRSGDRVDVVALAPSAMTAAAHPAGRPDADVVARRVTVLAVLPPAADNTGARVVIATTRALAVRLAGLGASREFAIVVDFF